MLSVPNLSGHLQDAMSASTDQEKDAIFSKALVDATKYSAPLMACAWTSSTSMVNRGLAWFDINRDDPIFVSWDSKYQDLKMKPPSMEQLIDYQKCALKWRRDLGYGIMPETSILVSSVLMNFAVPSTLVISMKDMISDMIRRKGGPNLNRKPVNPEHIDCCELIMGGNLGAVLNPSWGELDKVNSKGQMLLTTGFANLINRNGNESILQIDDAIKKFDAWNQNQDIYDKEKGNQAVEVMKFALDEAQKMGGGAAGYRSQVAQMDTVFSSYYWLWKSGVKPNSFSTVSDFLFELGQAPRGNSKVIKALTNTGLKWGKPLVSLFADNSFKQDRIHMHPGVLTAGRLSEMGVCFGVIPASRPIYAAKGSGFAKSILNIKTSGNNPAANVIVQLFDIQKQARTLTDMDVVSSEHLLHQILVSKRSPFQNAFQVSGNPTDVNIITALMDAPGVTETSNEASKPKYEEVEALAAKKLEERRKKLSSMQLGVAKRGMTPGNLPVPGTRPAETPSGHSLEGLSLVSLDDDVAPQLAQHQASGHLPNERKEIKMSSLEASKQPNQGVHFRQVNYQYSTPAGAEGGFMPGQFVTLPTPENVPLYGQTAAPVFLMPSSQLQPTMPNTSDYFK
nr:MAG: nucleoprotein [Wufeng shrew orthonairovirus 3]